ncbi:hypothetical protein CWI84_02190 [Idiomarina tyrosinivorans]|uniref:DUF4194 domain-containing protein n=1 Tax=Idiomarina tyrosinivorans TaxID=1445662 RepID=A0A432ZSP6_9GAMM|nr:DUF4194 domain-containing protein [Idiomarina tyrosinivorans]RUO80944.1 hypothetical protein CWI84_02190 [Idiomarina tyrosinivorans]
MLRDLRAILDKTEYESLEEEQFQEAAAFLRRKQFIFSDGHGHRKHYELIRRFKGYFAHLFDAFGDELKIDESFGFIGFIPSTSNPPMKMLDTIFLLILAKLHDLEARRANTQNGRASPSPGILIDSFIELTGREKPKKVETKAALKRLEESGVIRLGENDKVSELPLIEVLPTIHVVVTDDYLDILKNFAKCDEEKASSDERMVNEYEQEDPIASVNEIATSGDRL